MSFKRLIPLAVLGTVLASGTVFAANQPTANADNDRVQVRKQVPTTYAPVSKSQSAPDFYQRDGWPRADDSSY
jgi:hypothetical protein